jgi:CheY-like chemotaxis protein
MDFFSRRPAWIFALSVGAPLLLAVVELFHPHPGDVLSLDVQTWLAVHYAQILLFPLSALAVTALSRNLVFTLLVLLVAGVAWIAFLANVNAALQLFLPRWVRARGLAVYQMVLFGGQAAGALIWGAVAGATGLVPAFLISAVLMAGGAATIWFWPFHQVANMDRSLVRWPEPQLLISADRGSGLVLVRTTYTIAAGKEQQFLQDLQSDAKASPKSQGFLTAEQWNARFAPSVEDEQAVRNIARDVLQGQGYTVLEAKHGRDALLYEMYQRAKALTANPDNPKAMVSRKFDTPDDMFLQYGQLSYEKGSWVLHMLRSQLGDDLFRRCIKTYLERHQYDNVVTEDLRAIIEELSGRS